MVLIYDLGLDAAANESEEDGEGENSDENGDEEEEYRPSMGAGVLVLLIIAGTVGGLGVALLVVYLVRSDGLPSTANQAAPPETELTSDSQANLIGRSDN